jgi:hypothetical protein
VPNRLSARILEKKISRILQIVQSYEPEDVLKTFTQKIKNKIIEEKYDLISKSLKNRFGLNCTELQFIDNYSLEHPLRSMPVLRNTVGIHKGKFIGIKGKFLIYESRGMNALKLDELLGNSLLLKIN